MKRQFLSALLAATLVVSASCGGGGGSSGSTGDPSKLYSATLNSGSVGIGALVGDDVGNAIMSIMSSPGSNDVAMLLADFADGSKASATIQNGRPVSVTDGTTTATFANWNGTTVDVTITSGGESETITGVDYSEYAAQMVTKGWPQFFGATWTTITVAFCPVSIALAGASIGAGLPAAVVGCSLAATNLYRLLSGQSTLVEEIATYVSAPASCAAVAEDGGTASEQQQCMSDTLTTLPSVPVYVNEYGEFVTEDDDSGGGTTFAGSCSLQGGTTCVNYVGSDMSAADSRAGCEATGGTYSSGACPTAGVVGVCTVSGGTANEYRLTFYDTLYTEDVARQTCSAMNGTWSS
jgi:hypothetical protein